MKGAVGQKRVTPASLGGLMRARAVASAGAEGDRSEEDGSTERAAEPGRRPGTHPLGIHASTTLGAVTRVPRSRPNPLAATTFHLPHSLRPSAGVRSMAPRSQAS
jgi:hypothetical protein